MIILVLDTTIEYLDTSPKYPNPPRFRFRARFVSVIVQASINNIYEKTEHHYYGMNDVEKACAEYTKKYRGMTVGDLCRHFDLQIPQGTNKQIIEKIIARMFGGTKKISKIEQFAKFGLHGQTVVITQKLQEYFPTFYTKSQMEKVLLIFLLRGRKSKTKRVDLTVDVYGFRIRGGAR